MRSFDTSPVTVESDLERLRFNVGVWDESLGVVAELRLEPFCGSGILRLSLFHLRCLFGVSLLTPPSVEKKYQTQLWAFFVSIFDHHVSIQSQTSYHEIHLQHVIVQEATKQKYLVAYTSMFKKCHFNKNRLNHTSTLRSMSQSWTTQILVNPYIKG